MKGSEGNKRKREKEQDWSERDRRVKEEEGEIER